MIYPANILITNYCNQKCPFCFASREMGSSTLDRELSLDHFKLVLAKIKKSGYYQTIKLLGGEPTLHSQLFSILDLASHENLKVQIFTNGIMDEAITEKLLTYGSNIGYTFNCSTPGFQMNKMLHEKVLINMIKVATKSKVTLSTTIDPYFKIEPFNKLIEQILPQLYSIRIGFSNPIAHTKNWYTFSEFPKMGAILVNFMKDVRVRGFEGVFSMNCGFTRCMFANEEYTYITSQIKKIGWSCFGKESSMDIATNMTAFHCFPLSNTKRIYLHTTGYKKADSLLMKERMHSWSRMKNEKCLTCPFYGFGGDKCPGPCIAFQTNAGFFKL